MDDVTTRLSCARPIRFAIAMTILADAFHVVVWSWQSFAIRTLADNVARTITGNIAMVSLESAETIASVKG